MYLQKETWPRNGKWVLNHKRDGTQNFTAFFRFAIAKIQTACSSWPHHLIDHNGQGIQTETQIYSSKISSSPPLLNTMS